MVVRALTADDVAAYREIRLAALQADPGAFASTYEREAAFADADWRRRIVGTPDRPFQIFADDIGGRLVSTAGIGITEWDAAPMLVAMWVRPEARRTGSARRLIEATVAWAGDREASEVVLWVVKDNTAAIRLYTAAGFAPSGKTDTLPSNPCAEELEMRLALGSPAAGP